MPRISIPIKSKLSANKTFTFEFILVRLASKRKSNSI